MTPLSLRRPFGFARSMRITKKGDFDRTFAEGGRARGSTLAIVVRENGLGHSRLGLSVGRKVWKSAVRRNRIRRIFREAFRLSRPELPEGLDMILMAARPRLEPTLAETCDELVRLASKAHGKFRARQARRAADATNETAKGDST